MEQNLYNPNVFIRIRPVLNRELSSDSYNQCCATINNKIFITKSNKPLLLQETLESNDEVDTYLFDEIFSFNSTQQEIYEKIGLPALNHALQGYNTTIFAYGQTGSGKTFTIEGSEDNAGLIYRIVNELFNCSKNEEPKEKISVVFTCIQIYMEKITDLLDEKEKDAQTDIKIITTENGFDCLNLTEKLIKSPEEAIFYFKTAQKRRVVKSTKMNDFSSRGHALYTFKILHNIRSKGNKIIKFSKFNIVDLAGSERITKTQTTGVALKESISINKSLYPLLSVVNALTNKNALDRKCPPFRESKLTMLLKDSLGGNCITSLIATISPSLSEVEESISTLRFANNCKQITNTVVINEAKSKLDAKKRLYGSNFQILKNEKEKKKPKSLPWVHLLSQYNYNSVSTKIGEIHYIENDVKCPKKSIILLHACPSSASEFLHFFPSLSFYNYKIFAIDQPGYGRTPGKTFPCNSLKNLEKGGPVDVVINFIEAMKIEGKVILGGYDWGGGIALSFTLKYPKLVDGVISIMPSYKEPTGNELKCLSVNCLIIWVESDQMHVWSKWKPLAEKIPRKKIELLKIGSYSPQMSSDCYEAISNLIMRPIVIFLGEADPLLELEELEKEVVKNQLDTKGKNIKANLKINFVGENIDGDLLLKKNAVDKKMKSVFEFKKLYSQIGDQIFKEFLSNNQQIITIFNNLPEISYEILQKNPSYLVQMNIWSALPLNITSLWSLKKYSKNRRVHVLIPCSGVRKKNGIANQNFLLYDQNSLEKFLSPFGRIQNYDKEEKRFLVEVMGVDNKLHNLTIPANEIFLYNNGQCFYKNEMHQIELEDGIRANYQNSLVKAKILEIAFGLEEITSKMDFLDETVEDLQKEAILKIRKKLNLISFAKDLNRDRFGRTDCVGKLGVYGQAQCHGLSSTLSAYLYPFHEILGVDLLYRGGYSFLNDFMKMEDVEVSNYIEKHQWIQINLFPSSKSYIVDVWYQEAFDDDKYLMYEVEEGCRNMSYPHPKLLLKNNTKKLEEDIIF